MPSGACVLRRDGPRGAVFSVKYRDAAGRQIKERLGREADGWSEAKAQRELGKRLDLVVRERYRKPEHLSYAEFAERFQHDYLPGRNLKHTTLVNYELSLRVHLVPFFGRMELAAIEPEQIDAYIATKTRQGSHRRRSVIT